MSRVEVHPELLEWAITRSRKDVDDLASRFKKLPEWLAGTVQPTFNQLSDFAKATSSPLGYLLLSEPPDEPLPIPDFRTLNDDQIREPSANLLDTLYTMQQRQDWLRETLIEDETEPLPFVGSVTLQDNPDDIAHEIRGTLGLADDWARIVRGWKYAVSELLHVIDGAGILAVINGVVGNNTHRSLDVYEFRGFALPDNYAPLIFVNGADWESAKMFTLAHELAHIWLGAEAISGFDALQPDYNDVEKFCNLVAAEFLVPKRELQSVWPEVRRDSDRFIRLARRFRVSSIVCARRALDLGLITRDAFFKFYNAQRKEYLRSKGKGGGDFYNNQNRRVGERFATEVIRAAKEGRLLFSDAYQLTGLYGASFKKYAERLNLEVF